MTIKSQDRENGDLFNKEEHAGHRLVIEVLDFTPDVPTQQFGPQDAVRVNILDLDTGRVFQRALLFGNVLVDRLKSEAGNGDQSVYTLDKAAGKRYWNLFSVNDETLDEARNQVVKHPNLFTQNGATEKDTLSSDKSAAADEMVNALETRLAEQQQ